MLPSQSTLELRQEFLTIPKPSFFYLKRAPAQVTIPHKIIPIIILATIASAGVIAGLVYAPGSPGPAYDNPPHQAQKPSFHHHEIAPNPPIVTPATNPSSTNCKNPGPDLDRSASLDNETTAAPSSDASSTSTSPQPFTTIIIPNTGCLQHHSHCDGTVNMHAHKHNGKHLRCDHDQD